MNFRIALRLEWRRGPRTGMCSVALLSSLNLYVPDTGISGRSSTRESSSKRRMTTTSTLLMSSLSSPTNAISPPKDLSPQHMSTSGREY